LAVKIDSIYHKFNSKSKMSKERVKVTLESNEEEEKVNIRITIPEEAKSRIPRPGDSIYIIEPYPADDEDDENESKEKAIMGYSYAGVMAKSVVLSDELDEVLVNGDYKIPLYKNAGEFNKRTLTFGNEEEAIDKYRTLMTTSIKEAKRRKDKNANIQSYLEEALEKMHH